MVNTCAATPSSTSLKTIVLLGDARRTPDYQLRHIDSFYKTPLLESEETYIQPPQEWYNDSPGVVWRLKHAMYGLRASPRLWQLRLCRVLKQQGLVQRKSDRFLFASLQLIVQVYVDDLLLIACPTTMDRIVWQLKETLTLKHATTLSLTQDIRFLGE